MNFSEFVEQSGDSQAVSEIKRYIEFCADRDCVSIEESAQKSVTRLMGHLEDDTYFKALITAQRGSLPKADNKIRYMAMKAEFRRLGWGFVPVIGGYEETGGPVQEDSFLVLADAKAETPEAFVSKKADFLHKVRNIAASFEQESILVKFPRDPDGYYVYPPNAENPRGGMDNAGKWEVASAAEKFYTRPRKQPNRKIRFPNPPKAKELSPEDVENHFNPTITNPKFEAIGDESISTKVAVDMYFYNKKNKK